LERRARSLPIPTQDKEVRLRLREMGQPVCLFGEEAGDRRERLRAVAVQYYIEHEGVAPTFCMKKTVTMGETVVGEGKAGKKDEEVFYTEGTKELREARMEIARYSLPRAQRRMDLEKVKRS
jgi:U4/U6 small nuclear ribonucleoprotein PRP4